MESLERRSLKIEINDLKDFKILITGHTGFKGSWLCEMLLQSDIEVSGISLAPPENSLFNQLNLSSRISRHLVCDVLDTEELDQAIELIKPDLIFHFAAQSIVSTGYDDPILTWNTNVIGTLNLLNSVSRQKKCSLVIVATTDKVYKNTNSNKKFSEDDQLEGNDPYSASKVAAESAIKAWQKIRLDSSSPIVLAARSGNVVGGGDFSKNRLIPDLVRGFSSNETVYIRNPGSTRPWQHVTDSLYGYLRYIEESLIKPNHDALNFGPIGKSKSVQEVVEIAQETWGGTTNVKYQNNTSKKESSLLDLDPSLAISTLKWQPYLTQEQAVVSSMVWWKKLLIEKVSAIDCCVADIKNLIR